VSPALAAKVALIWAAVPVKVTVFVPLPEIAPLARPLATPAKTDNRPLVTVKVTVKELLSISATEMPLIDLLVSSFVLIDRVEASVEVEDVVPV
jgi:hypothetical protein